MAGKAPVNADEEEEEDKAGAKEEKKTSRVTRQVEFLYCMSAKLTQVSSSFTPKPIKAPAIRESFYTHATH